jgi:riboflavin kinase/FMN adenylyltransferase
MRRVTDLAALERGRPAILTIGAFDGVHRGHQYLIRQIVDRARRLDYEAVIITFDPRPQVVLRPGSKQLTDGEEKARIIGALAPDVLAMLPFSADFAQVPAGQFLVSILERINLAEIWVGADFAFGHNREGNVEFLIRSSQSAGAPVASRGFAVHVVPRQPFGGAPLSSTRIREHLDRGDVSAAATLLGHYFRVPGTVARGAGRGSELGFPTANLAVSPIQHLPTTGIYAAYLHVPGWPGGRSQSEEALDPSSQTAVFAAAVSVGYNVQFGGEELTVEAYALDFDGDLRGRRVALDFVARIRDEQRFPSVEHLVEAIGDDVSAVRRILDEAAEPGELILESV